MLALLLALSVTQSAQQIDGRALAFFQNGLLCHNQRDWTCAETEYGNALRHDPTLVSAAINLAIVYEAQKNLPEALKYYNEAARVAPNSFAARYNRGQFHQKQGALELARTDYAVAVAIKKDASIFVNLAGIEIKLFDEKKGINFLLAAEYNLREADRLKTKSPAFYFNRARIAERKNFPARARYLYEEAMRHFAPESAEYRTCALRVERLSRSLR